MDSTNDKNKKSEAPTEVQDRDIVESILRWAAVGIGALCLLLIFWLYRPWVYDWVTPDPSATPTVSTSTPMNTPTPAPTWTPVPSITPTASPIPLPTSAYVFPAGDTLDPTAPGYLNEPIVLDESKAIVNPDLTNLQWTSSSQIATQLNFTYTGSFYATYGPGSITWKMDTALKPGYYELFVMDTAFSSGGTLQFQVATNDVPISGLTGTQKMLYRSSTGNYAQTWDMWHSIGVFQLPENNLLSVSTQWDVRDEYSIVAVDRILVSHLPDDTGELLQSLPVEPVKYILDDEGAKIDSDTSPVSVEDNRSWGDQSTVLINPPYDSKVSWEYPDLIPLGTYEIAVFIPKLNGNAEVTYQLYANDVAIPQDQLGGGVSIRQSQYQDTWMSLGDWTVPLTFAYPLKLKLEMSVNDGSIGEVAIDAVAFMLKSMPEILNQ